MKIKVQNIAKIKSAEIELNGITIIAGYNSTGKSTISKALVYVLRAYKNLTEKISDNRISSMMSATNLQLRHSASEYAQIKNSMSDLVANPSLEISDELVSAMSNTNSHLTKHSKSPAEIKSRVEHYRRLSDSEYAVFIVNKSIQDGFGGLVNTIGSTASGTIEISDDAMAPISIRVENNQVTACPIFDSPYNAPTYIEPRHLLDEISSKFPFYMMMDFDTQLALHAALASDSEIREVSMADEDDVKKALSIAKNLSEDILHGKLKVSEGSVTFFDSDFRENIPVSDTASGIKSMAYILRLLENRELKRGDILVIDEPEVNLHPEWQLAFADFLVQLSKALNINILLNTHSPYFLRAIEVYSERHETSASVKLYMTIPSGDSLNTYVAKDFTANPENVFEPLYRPFEKL